MCVQYIMGCSVLLLGAVKYIGGYHEYIGISWIHQGVFSTSGIWWCMWDMMYVGGCSVHRGDYHEYIGGIPWVHRGDTMSTSGDIIMHVGEQVDKAFQFPLKTPMYSWYSPMYSWYPPDVLNIPWCTEHPPMYSWYPPMYSWYPPMY